MQTDAGAAEAATPATDTVEPTGAAEADESPSWGDVHQAISDLGEGVLMEEADGDHAAADPSEDDAADEGGTPGAEAGSRGEAGEGEDEEQQAAAEDDGAADRQGEGPKGSDRTPAHRFRDGEGKFVELPADLRTDLKADGRTVTVTMPKLIQYASQGIYADRRLSEIGEERASLHSQVSELRTQLEEDEDLLFRVLFPQTEEDHDRIEATREELAKYADPEVRAALRKGRQADEQAAASKSEQERANQQLAQAVWDDAASRARDGLERYEFLRESDVPSIQAELYRQYADAHGRAYQGLRGQAERGEIRATEEQLRAAAEKAARTYALTVEGLDRVMQSMNDRYAERVPTGRKSEEERAAEAEADVDAHNTYVDEKKRQGQERHRVKGGAAPAAGRALEQPASWEEGMSTMRRMLREA